MYNNVSFLLFEHIVYYKVKIQFWELILWLKLRSVN